jgi:hypothetical protein
MPTTNVDDFVRHQPTEVRPKVVEQETLVVVHAISISAEIEGGWLVWQLARNNNGTSNKNNNG